MGNENLEDFDIDKLLDSDDLFRPLSEGLGFHHHENELLQKNPLSIKEKQNLLKNDLERKMKDLTPESTIIKAPAKKVKISMGELSAFYKPDLALEKKANIELKEDLLIEEASLGLRFAAWLVDSIIIVSFLLLTFLAMMFLSDLPLAFVKENLFVEELLSTIVVLSLAFYIFYFAFFDKTSFSTIGKKIFNIKVVSLEGKNISLRKSMLRSFLCILFSPTLGLGSLLSLQDKFSETMVIHGNGK